MTLQQLRLINYTLKKAVKHIYSEEQLIAGCIADDRDCQEFLYRKFADKMYNISLTYTDDEDEACDILQEGFIKVFRNIQTFNSEGSLEGWIRRIIVNTALEFYRKKKREKEVMEAYENFIECRIDGILEKINTDYLIRLVNRLPMKAQLVLKLYAIEGFSHKEIAEQMEISEGTSKSQLNRARFLLKEAISRHDG